MEKNSNMATNKTLKDLKVGDRVWNIQQGWTTIKQIDFYRSYPLSTNEGDCYTFEVKFMTIDKYPSLFLNNPFEEQKSEQQEFEPRWMLVSHENIVFKKRYVVQILNGFYLAIDNIEKQYELDEILSKQNITNVINWPYAKEILDPIELTMDEIADRFGISVEQLKIKK